MCFGVQMQHEQDSILDHPGINPRTCLDKHAAIVPYECGFLGPGSCCRFFEWHLLTDRSWTERRLAIRAAKLGPKPTLHLRPWVKIPCRWNLGAPEKRGSFEGAIRILMHALLFLFNDLAFLGIPHKSLKFQTLLFSIPTSCAVCS
jgi:hypothetical protein